MALELLGSVAVPPFRDSGFDHGDVHLATGRLFVAHTRAGSVEVVDGERRAHVATIPGCPEASGVPRVQDAGVVFAAAPGAGRGLGIDPPSATPLRGLPTRPRPHGPARGAPPPVAAA